MPRARETQALPVLPLATGVVLRNTVVTLTLETDRPGRPSRPRDGADGFSSCPASTGGMPGSGRWPRSRSGGLPNGLAAAIIRRLHCPVLGTGVAGTGAALWVEAQDVIDGGVGGAEELGPGAPGRALGAR